MLQNKKGAALMQVLLVTAVLAGMATMLLRASLSRTSAARQTRQTVSSELLIEACQAEVNMMWSNKKPEVFKRDLAGCWMNCKVTIAEDTWNGVTYTTSKCHTTASNATRQYTCKVPLNGGGTADVVAEFSAPEAGDTGCELGYTLNRSVVEGNL